MVLRSQRTTARAFRRGCLAWCSIAVVVLAACSSGSREASSSPPSVVGSSTTSSADGGASSTTTEATTTAERAYPAGGPTDAVFPPGDQGYELVTGSSGCEELLSKVQKWPRAPTDQSTGVDEVEGVDTYPLYESAAYACLGRWADARRSFAEIHTATPSFNNNACARLALLAWLTTLIQESRSDPTFAPVFVPSSAPSPCPPDDTGSSVDSGSSTTTSTTSAG